MYVHTCMLKSFIYGINYAWHYGKIYVSAKMSHSGVSWPSGLAYRTQVLVLAAECGFESRP